MRDILIVSGNIAKSHVGSNHEWLNFRNQGAHRAASALRCMGRDVEVVDNAQWFSEADVDAFLATRIAPGSAMLAFSVAFWFGGRHIAKLWADKARALAPGIKIAVCGPKLGTALDFLPGADIVMAGYSEAALSDLLGWLAGKPGLKAKTLPGGVLAVSCQADYAQAELPELLTKLEERDFVEPGESLFLEASRGCVFKCAFCDFHLIGKRKGDYIRPREAILAQMREHARWGVKNFILSDETSNELDAKLEDLAWAAKESGIDPKLSGFVRADLMAARPHQLDLMEQAGLLRWHCGLETFNEKSAKAVGKGAMAGRKVAAFLESAKAKLGDELSVSASIIVGLPHDTVEDVSEAAIWAHESKVISHTSFFRLWLFDKQADHMNLLASDGLSMLAGDPSRYGYQRLSGPIPAAYANEIESREFLWKSQAGMDIFQASDLANELSVKHSMRTRRWRDYSLWARGAAAGLGLPALTAHDALADNAMILMLHDRRAKRYVRRKIAWSDLSGATAIGDAMAELA